MANYVLRKLNFGDDDEADVSGSDGSSIDWGSVISTGIQAAGAVGAAVLAPSPVVAAPTPVVAPIVTPRPAVSASASSSGLMILGGAALVLFLVLKKG